MGKEVADVCEPPCNWAIAAGSDCYIMYAYVRWAMHLLAQLAAIGTQSIC